MQYQIRIERITRVSEERSDSLEYLFGPSPSMDSLFKRLALWLDNESDGEYRLRAGKSINEVTANPAFDSSVATWPILLSFCVDVNNTTIDAYIVECVDSTCQTYQDDTSGA